MTENIKLRRLRQRRYKADIKVGLKYFKLLIDCDLLQRILREIAPERLPQKASGDDNSHTELQHAFSGYMQDEWLSAWSDVFGLLQNQRVALVWSATCSLTVNAVVLPATAPVWLAASTLTVDAIVLPATRSHANLQTVRPYETWKPNAQTRYQLTASSVWIGGPPPA